MLSQLSDREFDVGVVIATYNRYASLLKTLDSLSSQTLATSRFEVIVVDDGSTDATPHISMLSYPFHLNYVRQQNQGGVTARSHGAEVSRSKLLVFLDDDITLGVGYLQAILEAHHGRQKLISMGGFLPYLTGRDSTFAILYPRVIPTQTPSQTDQLVPFTECVSNNLAIERQDFLDVGMWHDVLGGGPGIWSDVEFGYRAWEQGFEFLRIAKAKLYHRDYAVVNLQSACERAYYVSRQVHLLFEHTSEIRDHLPMFWDKCPISLFSDSPRLIARKILRTATSSPLALWIMGELAHLLETKVSESLLLIRLYRWIISAYIHMGYRQGPRELAGARA